jgi:hypothetical protein
MLTFVVKWISVAALLIAMAWRTSAGYELVLLFIICAGAVIATVQSYALGKYIWAIGFLAVAILFNPISPFVLSRALFLSLGTVSLGLFLVSLQFLRTPARLSIASITDRTPGSESL